MIYLRFVSIAVRRYGAEPESRDSLAAMMARNALRICIHHLGRPQAAKIALETLTEDDNTRAQACS